MVKIYLDNCCYNRPFDDQSQFRIKVDTIAVLYIQNKIKNGFYQLTWSDILDFENGNNPFDDRRAAIEPWGNIATERISSDKKEIYDFADNLCEHYGLKLFDALHIACAIYAKDDYFITTDKKLFNTCLAEIKIVSPSEFIEEMEASI